MGMTWGFTLRELISIEQLSGSMILTGGLKDHFTNSIEAVL